MAIFIEVKWVKLCVGLGFQCFPDFLQSSFWVEDIGLYSNKLKYNNRFELQLGFADVTWQ